VQGGHGAFPVVALVLGVRLGARSTPAPCPVPAALTMANRVHRDTSITGG
jgi:hypothetical protein